MNLTIVLAVLVAAAFGAGLTIILFKVRKVDLSPTEAANQSQKLAESLLGLNQKALEQSRESAELTLKNLISPLQSTIEVYQKNLAQLESERRHSIQKVESELHRLFETSSKLANETNVLSSALKKPNVRGRWGEIQLKNCVELAGMSEFCDVEFHAVQNLETQTLIPDLTVRMPGGRVVVVDAKTPLEAFLAGLEASNDTQKQAEFAKHARHVKEHVRKLAAKSYHDNMPTAIDFTVLFLPNESFLYAALEHEPDLIEFAVQKKILIATPPTLIGLLKAIRYGWTELKLTENAREIASIGSELHKRICDYLESFNEIGESLRKALLAFETSEARLQSRVITQAKRLEKLGAKSSKELTVDNPN